MKKKALIVLLAGIMAVAFTACGSTGAKDQGKDTIISENKEEAPDDNNQEEKTESEEDEQEQETPDTSEADSESETEGAETEEDLDCYTAMQDLMQSIYQVAPGAAGSSLRSQSAAGKLMDFAQTYGIACDSNDIISASYDWFATTDYTADDITEAFEYASTLAKNYAQDVDAAKEEMEDCGYELQYDSYKTTILDQVINDIQEAIDMVK